MGSGGVRPNAGRKKGYKEKRTIEREEARERITQKVIKELDSIIEAQIDLAKGHLVEEITSTGRKRIYSKSPDKNAAELLLAHGIGKPTEHYDHTTGGERLMTYEQASRLFGRRTPEGGDSSSEKRPDGLLNPDESEVRPELAS